MEPDILIVDEVLSVGDAEFQKKCLGKMDEVTKEAGRTILFVSHNMSAIQSLCARSILLEDGKIKMVGDTKDVIDKYLNAKSNLAKIPLIDRKDRKGTGIIKFTNFHIEDKDKNILNNQNIKSGSSITFVFGYKCSNHSEVSNVDVGFSIHTQNSSTLSILYSSYLNQIFNKVSGEGEFRFNFKELMLTEGEYKVGARITVDGIESDWPQDKIGLFTVNQNDIYTSKSSEFTNKAPMLIKGEWEISASKKFL